MKTFAYLIESLRPKQWTKNLIIFAGILFAQRIFDVAMLLKVLLAFGVFCLLSGAVYIINDLVDLDHDKSHPSKSSRPLASGKLSPMWAKTGIAVLIPFALTLSYLLGVPFFVTALAYLLLQIAYSFILKHVVILDVFSIAFGFVLRVVAGAVVISVAISSWLIICTILLSLFLGLNKRRRELEVLESNAQSHRKVLDDYSVYLLDQMISVVTASTVISYALYTMSAETIAKFGTTNLIYTVPFVLYGILRYLYLVHKKGEGGNPENVLVSDVPLIINIALWAVTAGVILYR